MRLFVQIKSVVLSLAAAAALTLAGAPARAVVNGTPVPDSDRRFDAVGIVFTAQPWQPCAGWISGTCTLVAPNLVIFARHSVQLSDGSLPATGARTHRVRFRRGRDGTSNGHISGNDSDCAGDSYQEAWVREFVGAPLLGVDLALGFLESPVLGIAPIGVDTAFQAPANHPVVLAGWGYDGECIQTGEAWTLRYDHGVLPPPRWTSGCCFEYNRVTLSAGCLQWPVGSDWVKGNLHDSGAPILIEVPDPVSPGHMSLKLVGVVTSYTGAMRIGAWNQAGGQPVLSNPVPRTCVAEFDNVPGVTIDDILAYLSTWLAGDPRADINQSGDVTLGDLMTYVEHFVSGC